MRQIKNGVIVDVDGEEQFYELADQATRKILPMIQKLFASWQESKKNGKISMVFELFKE